MLDVHGLLTARILTWAGTFQEHESKIYTCTHLKKKDSDSIRVVDKVNIGRYRAYPCISSASGPPLASQHRNPRARTSKKLTAPPTSPHEHSCARRPLDSRPSTANFPESSSNYPTRDAISHAPYRVVPNTGRRTHSSSRTPTQTRTRTRSRHELAPQHHGRATAFYPLSAPHLDHPAP